ncbi:MAG: integrin alpha, partial [Nitrosomonas sp.]
GGGDINGDGFDDVIVGAPHAFIHGHYNGSGVSYVIFGKASGFNATMNMSSLDGNNGFSLIGGESYDLSGYSVSIVGDINGDGLDDLIIGAPVESRGVGAGSSYIMFGRTSGFEAEIDLSDLDGNNGFRLNGINNHTGRSLSNAGDMNGDGFSDLMIGAQDFAYIVFGKASGFAAEVNLADLDGNNGFRLEQVATYDDLGRSVSGAGDINGDGFDDVIVGASGADTNGMDSGSSYVIFGKASGFTATMDLSKLDGTNGFRLDGTNNYSLSGSSVSGAGDINGDGFDELLVGEPFSGANGNSSGANYIIFGKASGFSATLALADLDGRNGFRIDGLTAYDGLGGGSSAGDVNGDGFDDLIMSAAGADPNGINSGSSYVIFGSRDFGKKDVPEIMGTLGDDILRGTSAAEILEGGDGIDLLIGGGGADVFRGGAGVDHIKIPDLAFQKIDGGSGNDVLHLGGKDLNLDLTVQGDQLASIEIICIYGRGNNNLSLTAGDVTELSDTTNVLKLHGNAGDHVTVLDKGWVDDGATGFYHRYTNEDAALLVGANLAIDFIA